MAGPKEESSETKEETSEANQESSEAKQEDSDRRKPAKRTEDSGKRKKQTAKKRTKADETTSGSFWQEDVSTIKSWKKSVIPFERNQTRDVTIHYKARYAENDESVSDDLHISNATLRIFAIACSNVERANWQRQN